MAQPNSFLTSPLDDIANTPSVDGLLPGQDPVKVAPKIEMQEAPAAAPAQSEQPVPVEAPRARSEKAAKPASWLPPADQLPIYEASAKHFNVPVNVLMALGNQESTYRSDAVGVDTKYGKAKGTMQYLDGTAKGLRIDAMNPNEAIPAAAQQIRERLDKGASLKDAIMEHFAGPDRKQWGEKTARYGDEVMAKVGEIGREYLGSTPAGKEAPSNFAPSMPRDEYEQAFRANNPNAKDAAVANVMAQYDQQADARAAAPKQDKVSARFAAMQNPNAGFDAKLEQRLQGPANGVVPQLPGKLQPTPEPAYDGRDAARESQLSAAASYLGKSLKAGGYDLAGAGAKVLDAINPFTLSDSDAAVLFKNDPEQLKQFQDDSAAMILSRFAKRMTKNSNESLAEMTDRAKRDYGSLEYATTDTGKAAYLSPVKVIGDAVRSLPSSAAMAMSVYFTRGAAARAEQTALAAGLSPEVARQAAIAAGAKAMATTGAASEGAVGYAQQANQTADDVAKVPMAELAKSPKFQQLVQQGFAPEAARAKIIADTSEQAGVIAGLVDAAVNKVGGEFLGKILTEGGSLIPRIMKGAANESATEFVQSAGEQVGQNRAMQENVNPNQSLTEGVGEAAVAGAAVGGLMGGGMAGVGGRGPDAAPAAQPAPAAPAPLAAASAAPGPLSRSVENAAEQHAGQPNRVTAVAPTGEQVSGQITGYQEDGNGGFVAQIMGDDGQVHTLDSRTGVQVAPEAAPDSGPLSASLSNAAEQHAAQEPAAPAQEVPPVPTTEVPNGNDVQPGDDGGRSAGSIAGDGPVDGRGDVPAGSDAGGRQPAAGRDDSAGEQRNAAPAADAGNATDVQPALKAWERNPHHAYSAASAEQAQRYMDKQKIDPAKFEVKKTGAVRWQVVPKGEAKPAVNKQAAADAKHARQDAEVAKAAANIAARAAAKAALEPKTEIDAAAHEAATSPLNDVPEPTPAQKEAGNYAKGHIKVQGMEISVENPSGSVRSGTRPDGTTWAHTMDGHYGYLKRSIGADGEHVDVYVGDKPESPRVYVIDQIDQGTGKFDEHKVMLGYTSRQKAEAAYRANFDKGWKVGPVKGMSVDEFKTWLKDGDTTKPVASAAASAAEKVPEVAPKGRVIKQDPNGIAGEYAPGARESLEETLRTQPDISPTGKGFKPPPWEELPNGFAYRQYVVKGEPIQEVRGPKTGNVEPPVLRRGLQSDGKPYGEREATGALGDVLSGKAFADFDQYFKAQAKPAELAAPETAKPKQEPRRKNDAPDTPAFKKFFNGSKVVDADGKPLAMYHGTSNGGFDTFDTYGSNYGLMGMGGYFTADPEVASSYTTKGKGAAPSVYKTYLNIKNPIDMDARADDEAWKKQFDGIEEYHEGGNKNEDWYRAAEEMMTDQELPKWEGAEAMQDGLRAMGHDGITHIGGGRVAKDGVKHRVYVAFDPEQIKSATGSNGDFDTSKADIRYSVSGDASDTGRIVTNEQSAAYDKAVNEGRKRDAMRILHEASGIEQRDATLDRGGLHAPSGPEDGAPLFDVARGIYPEDVYSHNGLRFYGTGEDKMDAEAYRLIKHYEAHPNAPVTIYRAVEKDGAKKIQPGDWVTTIRAYAQEHGEANITGDFKIIKQLVHARDIFTSGDSWLEWGYHPQDFVPELPKGANKNRTLQDAVDRFSKRGDPDASDAPRYSIKDGQPQAEFGPVHTEYRDDTAGAVKRLMADKDGEAIVHRDDLGDISLIYGDGKMGLSHIERRRGAGFMQRLPGLLADGKLYTKPNQPDRVFIGTDRDEAVLRFEWDGKAKTWLLSAYEKYPDLKAAGEVQESRRSEVVDERTAAPASTEEVRKAVTRGVLGQVVASMIDAGVVVLHDTPKTLPRDAGRNIKGVQAVTTPDGKIHLVASNLTAKNANAVMLHEAFHEGTEKLLGTKQWADLMGRMGSLYRQGQSTSGAANAFWDKARARVAAAKAKGGVSTKMEVEEFAAYAIEEYESAPATVKKWVDDLIGMVKAWVAKRFGKQLGDVTPAQLSAFAKWALMDHAVERRGEIFGSLGAAFSLGATITDTPAFKKWFGKSKVVDENGEPLVVYHGSPDLRFMNEDGVFKSQKEKIGFGRAEAAHWFAVSPATARSYADPRRAFDYQRAEEGVIPAYLKMNNPLIVDGKGQKWRDAQKSGKTSDVIQEARDGGYDGVIIRNVKDNYQTGVVRGESATDTYVVFSSNQIKSADRNSGDFDQNNPDVRFSVADDAAPPEPSRYTPAEQGVLRRTQAAIQDNLNRLKQVQEKIKEVSGVDDLGNADYYATETNRPGRIAARLEDAQDKLTGPLMEELAKSGYTAKQLTELLHAQHAQERNEAVARINEDMPDGGSGMTTDVAQAIIENYKGDAALQRLAVKARAIARATLDLKLAYGLIKPKDHEMLATMYENYVPLKGDGEFGPKIKRAMGHDSREEHILENISRDYEQAVVTGEKNLARQTLLQTVVKYPDEELWTARVPPRGRYVAGKVYSVQDSTGQQVAQFTSQSQVSAFLEAKGPSASQYEVYDSAGERVIEFTKPLQDNEVMVYVNGDPVRLQIHDEKLAAQLRPLDAHQIGPILENFRKVNRYLSMIYTGYNPAFILRNASRDAVTGTINMLGNEGALTAVKAWKNYPAALAALGQFAATKKVSDSKAGRYLTEYRMHGGKTGASYMSDLEQQGKTLDRMFDDAYGAGQYLKDGKVTKAGMIAGRKMVGGLAHVVEIANQATENALRLGLFIALRDAGATPDRAAQAAKNVTVNFDRKGSSTGALGAIYLFFNPAVQGTANAMKTLMQGEHKAQAWAALGGLAMLGFWAASKGMDEDKDRWLGEGWDIRTKNLLINLPGKQFRSPMSQEFAPAYAFGVAMAEASRGESKTTTAARIVSSFIDAYFPLQGAYKEDSNNHLADLAQAGTPTVLKPLVESAMNRNAFGSQVVPETELTKDRPDNLKMNRGTKNTAYDKAAQGIASAGEIFGAGKYENDITKVSPETLKSLWRTYTGGLGTFVADSIGVAGMTAEDAGQVERSDVPIVKDFYRNSTVGPIRSRYYELSKEAKAAITEFDQAKKAGDDDELNKINDGPKGQLLSLGRMVRNTSKAAAAMGDEKVAINADAKLTGPEKREALRALEKEEEELYRSAIEAFK